ncbi:MAG: hydrogenase maturation nickel metallochaperone HypA [Alphaproteobacteria bacterium]|nr:hydrogenase maturation nickel metallochaperone HypA [Alphaproteobacteria bacterium]
MHEASLMNGLMRQIESIAMQEDACKVTKVVVWCGALSHMTEAHFAEHFDQAAKDTLAEGAALDVTVSEDITDDRALDVLLESIDVEG